MTTSDGEFVMLKEEIHLLRRDVAEIKEALAERRGAEHVVRWAAGGGGLAGVIALVASVWAFFRSGQP